MGRPRTKCCGTSGRSVIWREAASRGRLEAPPAKIWLRAATGERPGGGREGSKAARRGEPQTLAPRKKSGPAGCGPGRERSDFDDLLEVPGDVEDEVARAGSRGAVGHREVEARIRRQRHDRAVGNGRLT